MRKMKSNSKKNKRNGFALSGILYPILILVVFLVVQFLIMLGTRKNVLDKNKNEILDSVNNDKKKITAVMVLKDKAVSGNTEGLFIDDTADHNIRYAGSNSTVKNYVTFNNELWRIIGVFNGKLKIMRNESIGDRAWDTKGKVTTSCENQKCGISNWPTSDIKTYLNGTYLNSLNSDSKKMIVNETYYLGARSDHNLVKNAGYVSERGTSVNTSCKVGVDEETSSTCPRATTWIGKVGLIYPSDYGYAVGGECVITKMEDYKSDVCKSNNWMYNNAYQWTITSHTSSTWTTVCVSTTGSTYCGFAARVARGIRPTVYLNPNVEFIGGNGASGSPYQLGL